MAYKRYCTVIRVHRIKSRLWNKDFTFFAGYNSQGEMVAIRTHVKTARLRNKFAIEIWQTTRWLPYTLFLHRRHANSLRGTTGTIT